jgi:N6-adenosine-specific RNA methylase IME4
LESAESPSSNAIEGEFDVVVCDPPWPYENRQDDPTHRAANPYASMTIEELSDLSIPVGDDGILWLWTTNAFMHEAYHLAEAWGFEVKTILTWEKPKLGLGDWLRGITEHCLLCVKGKVAVRLTNQTTILHAPSREHSRKPDAFYEMVNALCPGRKLDMFSREPREGWSQHGNDLNKF